MPDLLFNCPHRLSGLDRRRTRDAANPPSRRLLGIEQVRVGLGKRLAFHDYIIADRALTEVASEKDSLK